LDQSERVFMLGEWKSRCKQISLLVVCFCVARCAIVVADESAELRIKIPQTINGMVETEQGAIINSTFEAISIKKATKSPMVI